MISLSFFKSKKRPSKKNKYFLFFLKETLYLIQSSPKMRHLNEHKPA